jgi:hypothetical protein
MSPEKARAISETASTKKPKKNPEQLTYIKSSISRRHSAMLFLAMGEGLVQLDDILHFPLDWGSLSLEASLYEAEMLEHVFIGVWTPLLARKRRASVQQT